MVRAEEVVIDVNDLDVLMAELKELSSAAAVDRAAEALAMAGEAVEALADREGYDTATLWWAAGTLTSAYTLLLSHTEANPQEPPPGPGALADNPPRLIELLKTTVAALDRAARATDEPQRIYALSRASDLADQGCRACVNARAVT